MNKGLVITIIATIVILIGGAIFLSGDSPTEPTPTITEAPSELEYYWGNGCPHCADVDEFLNGWDKKDEITLNKFETWYNKENQAKLEAVGAYCNIPANQIGVPLLFTTSGECLIGSDPIITHLQSL